MVVTVYIEAARSQILHEGFFEKQWQRELGLAGNSYEPVL